MTDYFDDIVVDNWGWVAKVTFTEDAVATPIDGFTTLELIFTPPTGASVTKDATDGVAFYTDGTDGILTYTVEEGLIDTAGVWTLRGRLTSASAMFTSVDKTFDVAHAA